MTASSRTVEHVGEWKVEVQADTLEEVFAEIACVIAEAAGQTVGPPGPWQRVELTARDAATLLVDWANELIGLSEVNARGFVESRDLRIVHGDAAAERGDEGRAGTDALTITGEVCGRPVAVWASPLKAATYHGAYLVQTSEGWRAEILFDV